MNKASECFLLGKVDDAIFHWMENIKRDPGRSTNSSVLVIASLLSCYRLRESLLFLNWCYLHNDTSLPAVTQVLAQVLYQYFTGKFSITWSMVIFYSQIKSVIVKCQKIKLVGAFIKLYDLVKSNLGVISCSMLIHSSQFDCFQY